MNHASSIISSEMNAALNEQIGNESSASLPYAAIGSYFACESRPELARHRSPSPAVG